MYALRTNLMIALLAGIPAVALTDFRLWSNTSPDGDTADELQPAVVTTFAPESDLRRLPDVVIGQQPWFAQAQQQLRACGATYVRMERWNTQQPIFHFRCDLPTESSEVRSFEALSGSPRTAVQQVLGQVRACRDCEATSRLTSPRPRLAEPKPSDGTSWR